MSWIFIVLGAAVCWTIWGFYSSNVEQAPYRVLEKRDGYEIRLYAPSIEAQVTLSGDAKSSLYQGFGIIARYIFGDNKKKASIAMTAPVTSQAAHGSEPIAMTAPVTVASLGDSHTTAFTMPASYTRETLPEPNDDRIRLVEVPSRRVAAKRISWMTGVNRARGAQEQLLKDLARDNLKAVGALQYAGYNAPWTPPWLIRNEVLVTIE